MNEITTFGSYLNDLLTLRGIDKKYFAATMNINRSLLYRFLNSEQLPDWNLLDEMIQKLNLRISEKKKLLESYECTLYGWEIVKGRKLISEMLDNLGNEINGKSIAYEYSIKNSTPINESANVMPIKGKLNVINTALSMLDSVVHNSSVSTVKIILQPEMEDFINVLTNVLNKIADNRSNISIQHIVRFKNTLLPKNKLHNLEILNLLLPLSFFENIYKIYYTTENLTSESYESFFPNFISIDSHTAFTFSNDYENGILYTSKCQKSIQLMNEEFDKIQKDCLPLFINFETYEKQLNYMLNYESLVQLDTCLVHPENGFYTFSIDFLKKINQLSEKKYSNILKKRIEVFLKRLEKSKFLEIISLKGLKRFATTGQFLIYGNIKFNKDERIEILKNLLKFVETNENYTLYIMKEENHFYDSDFAIYTIGSELLYIVPSYTDFKVSDNIIIRNKGIVESFTDFIHSGFTSDNCIIDKNEVASVISNIINTI